MNLVDKMNTWRALKEQADALEKDIAEEVKALGKTQKVDGVTCSTPAVARPTTTRRRART
jgi:hypothetical protein